MTSIRWWWLAACTATAVAAGLLLGASGVWRLDHPAEYAALMAAAMVAPALAPRQPAALHAASLPVFLVDFIAFLFLGPHAATTMAVASRMVRFTPPAVADLGPRGADAAVAALAIQSAGFAHQSLGGTLGHFTWPWAALPIASAVLAYGLVMSLAPEVAAAAAGRRAVSRAWMQPLVQGLPLCLIAASVAVGLVDAIDHQAWGVLLASAVPMYCAYHGYVDYARRLSDEQQRRAVAEWLDEGMSAIDTDGRITCWNDALERLVGCSRERALGKPLASAIPALASTELPKAIARAVDSASAGTLTFGMASGAQPRTVRVKIFPSPAGVTLLWYDVSERTRAEREMKRREERFALAAEAANDGLWEWDLRTQELYVSARWRAMLGLPADAAYRAGQWLERVHPDDIGPLKDAFKAHLAGDAERIALECRLRHEDGTYRRFLCRGLAAGGRRPARVAGSLTALADQAPPPDARTSGLVDALTGLCTRARFAEDLGRRLEDYKRRRSGERFAVLHVDLDRFKVVNDSLGHAVGDELLAAVARRLETCVRPGDALARLGGDEFAMLLNGLADEQQANAIALRIQKTMSASFTIGGREVFTSVSIGIAPGLHQYTSPEAIMRDADAAMSYAKARGRARHELFDAAMHARANDRLSLENDLRRAIDTQDFEVHYQPIVSLTSGMCVGFESLVRWKRGGQPVSPATFVPVAEELGLIEPLGTWVLQEACRTFADWTRRFPDRGLECITINASSRQLMQQNFVTLVERAVLDAGLRPSEVRIEITETALMDSPAEVAAILQQLREFGVKIYLDDFGTGYSSLSHLHRLPVDALKVDRSFVKSLLLPERPAIVESILALARTLNTSVVAEGVETEVQARELARLGCTHAQGYLFSRPLPSTAVEALLVANESLGLREQPVDEDPSFYYSSTPFEWPQQLPGPTAATA